MKRSINLIPGVVRGGGVGAQPRELDVAPEAVQLQADHKCISLSSVAFPQLNPSVFVRDSKLFVSVRVQEGCRSETYIGDADGLFRFRLEDKSLTIHGYEDLRPFELDGRFMAVASTFDGKVSSIVILRLARYSLDVEAGYMSPSNEKNWMPLVYEGSLSLIRSLDPLHVIEYDSASTIVEPRTCGALRGGSQFIKHGDRYVGIAHRCYWTTAGRVYLHHVVTLSPWLNNLRVGPAFYFQRRGIEFCAGLARWKGRWVLSYGLDDREAWLATSDLGGVMPS